MHKRLIIVGAGGLARELYTWASEIWEVQNEYVFCGFLSDYPDDLDGYDYPISIIGSIKEYIPAGEEYFLMGIADPAAKLRIASALEERGAKFITLIHPKASVPKNTKVGRGCVLFAYAYLGADVNVGNFVLFNSFNTIGHDTSIGDGCTVSSFVNIMGRTQIGTGVFVGSHASILPKAKVGDFATVGAGTVVVRSVKPKTTVFGVPAKVISSEEKELDVDVI